LFAADGIDELTRGFASRSGRLTSESSRVLRIDGSDSSRTWQLSIGPEGLAVADEVGDADCWISGPTSDLYLLLWNRRTTDGLQVAGDTSVLDHWRHKHQVR
jgi:predicted lipid carrier protein YhbT